MDESLKARLIGAVVLVAVAVLVIPELLSGRKATEPQPLDPAVARGTRTFTIELNGGSTAGDLPSPTVAEAPASAPVAVAERPADVPPVVTQDEPEPVAPPTPPAVAKASPATPVARPVETAPPAAPVTRGGWAVQVGAFGSAAAAQRLVRDLEGAGYRAFVSQVTRSGKTLHRVRVGPEAGRDDANRLAERLKGRGLPTAVVEND